MELSYEYCLGQVSLSESHLHDPSMEEFPAGLVGKLTNVSKFTSIFHGNEYVFRQGSVPVAQMFLL